MHGIDTHPIEFVRSLFDVIGWFGVVCAMTMESACIPLPSEIIMPLTRLLVAEVDRSWEDILVVSPWGRAAT